MKTGIWALFTGLLLLCSSAWPQQAHPPQDPMGENLFPPELIMQNQQVIGLEEAQKTFIRTEISKAQNHFTELQWQLQDGMEGLIGLLKQPKADEAQVAAQLDRVLASEREIKRAQISLLVRIKNNLTAEQQHRLQTLRSEAK